MTISTRTKHYCNEQFLHFFPRQLTCSTYFLQCRRVAFPSIDQNRIHSITGRKFWQNYQLLFRTFPCCFFPRSFDGFSCGTVEVLNCLKMEISIDFSCSSKQRGNKMENKLRDLRDCGLFENNSPHWNVTYQSLHTKMIEYLKESMTVCKVKDIPCQTSCTSIGGCLRILVNKRKLQTVKTWRSHESIPKRVERWILRNWLIHPVSVYLTCLLGITRFVPEASMYQRTKNRKKGKPRKIKRELNWNFPFCNFPFPISWSPSSAMSCEWANLLGSHNT